MNHAEPAAALDTRSVVVEREFAHAAEKIWRALTQPHLIQEWLMQSDFLPKVNHSFKFTADWGSVDCRVLEVEPHQSLSYTWNAYGLESVVVWTLIPTKSGTLLRMEQAGFRMDQEQAFQGAKFGWAKFFEGLENSLQRNN
jgi:uncharacterized protein YndB with AHSA1/START domain